MKRRGMSTKLWTNLARDRLPDPLLFPFYTMIGKSRCRRTAENFINNISWDSRSSQAYSGEEALDKTCISHLGPYFSRL